MLSTCNRVEVYAEVDRFHGGLQDASAVLANRVGQDVPSLGEHLYVLFEDKAVQHLFTVACGLDSMVVGEAQILGQLRRRTRRDRPGRVTRELHEVFQHALRVGKRAHSETGLDAAGAWSSGRPGLGRAGARRLSGRACCWSVPVDGRAVRRHPGPRHRRDRDRQPAPRQADRLASQLGGSAGGPAGDLAAELSGATWSSPPPARSAP